MKFRVVTDDRKAFVNELAAMTGAAKKYLGTPSYAFKVGQYTIEKDCTIVPDDDVWDSQFEYLIERLSERGYEIEVIEEIGLRIHYKKKDFKCDDAEKLRKLLGIKAPLIKKALGINDVTFENTSDELIFNWFEDRDIQPEEANAYTRFVVALCNYAKSRQYISGKKKEIVNEKFEFRCFLLRLGFIGEEYSEIRRILLQNLSGNAAFKNGRPRKNTKKSNEVAICEDFCDDSEQVIKTEVIATLNAPEKCVCR